MPPASIADPQERRIAEKAIKNSLAGGIRMALMLSALLALFGAVVAALTIAPSKPAAQKS